MARPEDIGWLCGLNFFWESSFNDGTTQTARDPPILGGRLIWSYGDGTPGTSFNERRLRLRAPLVAHARQPQQGGRAVLRTGVAPSLLWTVKWLQAAPSWPSRLYVGLGILGSYPNVGVLTLIPNS